MKLRPRILRKSPAVRRMIRETALSPGDLIAPLFIDPQDDARIPIPALPGYARYGLSKALIEMREIAAMQIPAVLLFIKCEDHLKDNRGSEAVNPRGLMQRAIIAIKEAHPEICVMTDVALDPYSVHGHDGIVEDGHIVNDATNAVLAEMAVSHADAGADFVAPSDMMDGRIAAIRNALEAKGYDQTGIMSYSAKYASCFYGPFRSALDSAPGFGDKKTYQMDPANRREALKEAHLDVAEGADIVMVKPALTYLDIIREVRDTVDIPVSAYHVSGEYAMIKAAAEKGCVNEDEAILETATAIKRAGADLIATYFAKDIVRLIS